jgi:hypothetical protein
VEGRLPLQTGVFRGRSACDPTFVKYRYSPDIDKKQPPIKHPSSLWISGGSKAAKKPAKWSSLIWNIALCLLKNIEEKKAAIDDDNSSDGTASS